MSRPDRATLHMITALMWAERSLCKRQLVGCVITNYRLDKILAFGYNGPAAGEPDDACTGEVGKCGCLHAERNAISRHNLLCSGYQARRTLFTTCAPCLHCTQDLIISGIRTVHYLMNYRVNSGLELFAQHGIPTMQFPATEISATIERLGMDSLLKRYLSIPKESL